MYSAETGGGGFWWISRIKGEKVNTRFAMEAFISTMVDQCGKDQKNKGRE